MFDNVFKAVKGEIKNEDKEFNVALIKFTKRFESFSQNQKVSAFQKILPHFSVENVQRSRYNLTRFQEENIKIGSRQRPSNVGTKRLPNRPISLKSTS